MARQLELESLCAECKDILGLRLLHLELCHSPAAPPPNILTAAFTLGTSDRSRGQIENDREPQSISFNTLIIKELEFG